MPPLQRIVGDLQRVTWTHDEIVEFFSLLPTLTQFESWQRTTGAENGLFLTVLASSPQLIPNLSIITIQTVVTKSSCHGWVPETPQRAFGPPQASSHCEGYIGKLEENYI
ncbi:hypothetical protein FB451DRAFT_1164461 [Mycena latifolia]|nr:hypothetical protein FB451DRAFT_1164461 [Mycena latifolia]